MNLSPYIAPILIAFVLSFLFTYLARVLAINRGWYAPVRDRDVHQKRIPRIGGVAIFLSFLITVLFYHFTEPSRLAGFGFPFAIFGFSIDKRLLAVLLGACVLTAFMIVDDIKGLKAYHKLMVQVIAALIVIAGGIGLQYLNNPFGGPELRLDGWQIPVTLDGVIYHFTVWSDLLVILWLVFLMNVLNFSDGIDGLAGSTATVSLFVLAILSLTASVSQPSTALLAVIGAGATLGFLGWNIPPARIFMGDSGSMFLGLLIGVLAIISGAKLATTVVVLAIPITDAVWVIVNRIASGKNPFTNPDQSHLHHKFIKAGFSVSQTLITLTGISLLFGVAALQRNGIDKVRSFLMALVIIVLLMIVVELLGRRQKA